ncbi:MAG TPA: arsenate reductase (glutaredoxin) [Phaeodactylibacter sp.]|nr:arsenate reductase (glutaredoxin) [Phaeodactylibacter sp.]
MKIYHNPRCSKSRQTLQLIKERGVEPEIVRYLDTPPTKEELRELLQKLGLKPEDIVRKKEALYKERYKGKTLSDEEWLEVLSQNPKLIERPIVVEGNKAVLGRPPERVLELF